VSQRLAGAALVSLAAIVASFAAATRGPWLAPFGIALGVWVMGGAVSDMALRSKAGQVPWREVWRRFASLPRAAYGTALAHFGVGLLVVGIVATSAYRSEAILVMKPGDWTEIAGYELHFRGVVPGKGSNYQEQIGRFDVTRGGSDVARLEPAKRIYDAPPQPTTEAGIHASWRGDLYAVLGDAQGNGGFAVRLYFNPLVRCIWIGALIMFIGGAMSLSDRRLRIGAPVRARRRVAPAPAE
jgi:cytochrome c-type biogenesis protein CcmF